MLVDSHCHLSSFVNEVELASVLGRAYRAGVSGFISVGTNINDCRLALTLAKNHPAIQTCIGIHPHEASDLDLNCQTALEDMIKDPSVRFVGETGLDWHYNLSSQYEQELAFRTQIQIAKRHSKPIMIHTRSAPTETIRILEEEGASQVGGIIHCFSEDIAFARKALNLGFYISFSGIVTFKNAEQIQEVAAWAPLDRILVETDSPYLAPVPFRGQRNEPAMIIQIVNQISKLKHITAEQLINAMANNMGALCGWPSLS
jgi:TatD DNase family protein